jgi:hypothetical protein
MKDGFYKIEALYDTLVVLGRFRVEDAGSG